jgi:ATP-dependent helicase/nuclease subunit A
LPELDEETCGQDVDGVHVLDPATLPEVVELADEERVEPGQVGIDAAAADLAYWVTARDAAIRGAARGLRVITASSVRPIDRVSPLALSLDAGEAAISLDLVPPVDVGTAVHGVMELVSLPDGEDLQALAAAVCAELGIGPATAEVAELTRRCLASPTVQRAIRAERFEREVPFSTVLDDGTHLAGRMDLLFRDGDELVIVDFKTDDVTDAAAVDAATVAHSGQAAAYALATERGTGLPVREVVFVYPRAGAERALPRAELSMTNASAET